MSSIILRLFPFLLLLLAACQGSTQAPDSVATIQGSTMGTTYRIMVSPDDAPRLPQAAVDSLLEAINLSMSTYIPTSTISTLNTSIDTTRLLPIGPHFDLVWDTSLRIAEETNGAFNPAIGPLISAWGFGADSLRNPDAEEVSFLKSISDLALFERIVTETGPALRKRHPGAQLDFSAIAKGYGVDALGHFLAQKGVSDFFIEIGGEVVTRGTHPAGRPWNIGIETPEPSTQRSIQAIIPLTNAGIATSGNYRNFIEIEGRRYVHTINPETGYPEENDLLSATIMAEDCMSADAYATAMMVMGTKAARTLIQNTEDIEGYLISGTVEGGYDIWASDGFPQESNRE